MFGEQGDAARINPTQTYMRVSNQTYAAKAGGSFYMAQKTARRPPSRRPREIPCHHALIIAHTRIGRTKVYRAAGKCQPTPFLRMLCRQASATRPCGDTTRLSTSVQRGLLLLVVGVPEQHILVSSRDRDQRPVQSFYVCLSLTVSLHRRGSGLDRLGARGT